MMYLRISPAILIAVLITVTLGCSGSGNDIPTMTPDNELSASSSNVGSHQTWGLWQFIADPRNETLEVVQLRTGDMHLNALHFLEPPPLIYLTISNLQITGMTVDVDVNIRHPFLGLDQFSGFDVCGILISDGSISTFDDPALTMAGVGDTRLLNADGYSRWWNPEEFPHTETMTGYKDGLLGTPDSFADYSGTLNAYKYFCDDLGANDPMHAITLENRGLFSAGQQNTRHYTIEMGSGGLIFNYAIDANWKFPQGSPPWTIPDDFGPNANRREAYRIEVTETSNTLYNDGSTSGGELHLSIDVHDWFNAEYNTVKVESPGNFTIQSSAAPATGGPGYSTYTIDITNATPAEAGIDLLIHVESEDVGYGGLLPDETVTSYFTHTSDVSSEPPIEDDGWARTWGSTAHDMVYGVAEDSAKNVYTTGYFYGTVNFNPDPMGTPVYLTSNGGQDIVVSKLNSAGEIVWAKRWGGPELDIPRALTLDDSGNIYVAAYFEGTSNFNPNSGTPVNLTSNGGRDACVSKLNPDGELVWAKRWGGASDDYGRGVTVDSSGNVYVGGYFENSANFNPDPGTPDNRISIGGRDPYLIKLDSDGNVVWAKTWGSADHDYGIYVAGDSSGNVCIIGHFTGTVNFNPNPGDPVNCTTVGLLDFYVSKFNTNGELQWARTWGSDTYDYAAGVSMDASGNVFVSGDFQHTCNFNPWGTPLNLTAGGMDPCVSKFDSDGNFQWAKAWGGSGHDRSYACAAGDSGSVTISGHFNGTVNFNPNPGDPIEKSSNGMTDAYIIKLDSTGDLLWARAFGASKNDFGYATHIGGSGNVYVAGDYQETVDFSPDPGSPDNHTAVGGYDHFVVKYLSDGSW